jgi:hypothetical protein
MLSPLSVPEEAWQMVSMDFIEGLPTSGNANCIMVVVDKLSKFAHFVPLRHPYMLKRLHKLSWTTSFAFTVCPLILSQTATQFSQVLSGGNYFALLR